MNQNSLCQLLEWDSDFFGIKIGRAVPNRLDPSTLLQITDWCYSEEVDCLYFLADSNHAETLSIAETSDFKLVDIRVTLEQSIDPVFPNRDICDPAGVRIHRAEDIPVLKEIAKVSFRTSRFYADGNFPLERCDALYETWVEKSCGGYADIVLVAEYERSVAGFVTCHFKQASGEIGLIGVSESVRGRGLGRLLVNTALERFADNSIGHISVVTQGQNVVAQRLYQRCGFITGQVQLWYHWWPGKGTRSPQ